MAISVVEIGHQVVDAQHKKLFQWLLELDDAFYEGKGHELIDKTLKNLQRYMHEHFDAEEQLIIDIGYPYLNQHRRLHNQLRSEVDLLIADFSDGKPVVSSEIIGMLRTWLIEHINTADADFAKYIKG